MIYMIFAGVLILLIILVLIRGFSKRQKVSIKSVLKDSYPNRSYGEIFKLAFLNAKNMLVALPQYVGQDTEILALLSRVGNVTVQWVGGDIGKYKSQIEEIVNSLLTSEQKKEYLKRENFYWGISYGDKIAGLWSLSDIPPSVQSVPMLRCAVAFGDCVTNPAMVKDYENAPLLLNNIDQMASFQKFFTTDFYRFIHTYCVMLAGREFEPPILKEYEK